ncbi:MAG: hypothetical protein R3E64_17150 [Halioglobus sp.]
MSSDLAISVVRKIPDVREGRIVVWKNRALMALSPTGYPLRELQQKAGQIPYPSVYCCR